MMCVFRRQVMPAARRALALLAWLLCAPSANSVASAQQGPTLTLTVLDQTDAVIQGAKVTIASDGVRAPQTIGDEQRDAHTTDTVGVVRVLLPGAGRYTVHVEAAGFAPQDLNLTIRRNMRRSVRLAVARIHETVDVGRDPRERATDPRADIFSTILDAAQIQELPDDPDEMERVLKEMAGPGAVIRVNGFRGGRLPPKDQIAQIRFRRNMFAADVHEVGFIAVDVVTRPGYESWRGSTSFGFRDASMNARNAFAPVRGAERLGRGTFTISGPLWRQRTSAALTAEGTGSYDAQTIVAAIPSGPVARNVRRPADSANLSARLEHALTRTHQLRMEAQRTRIVSDNLGVGNFDLEERAYQQDRIENRVRGSLAGSLGRFLYNELRLSWQQRDAAFSSASYAPTVAVLNAFTSGGAQLDGGRTASEWLLSDDLDIARGRHAMRLGFLAEWGRYDTTERRNMAGTYTFANLDAYQAGQPLLYTRTVGEPHVVVNQYQIGIYAQDDYRVSPALTLSGGIRFERQSRIGGLRSGPRGGFAWAPFKSGRTTVRGGAGIFFDWFSAEDYLRAVQLDGAHQRVETIAMPDYVSQQAGLGMPLSNGRTQIAANLSQPTIREMNLAWEQTLIGPLRVAAMLIHRRGSHQLRSFDVNAPGPDGLRAEPGAGPISEIRSSSRSAFDALAINVNAGNPQRRIFVAASYMFSRSRNERDSLFDLAADPQQPDAEWGPAADDARHRVMAFTSLPVHGPFSAGLSLNVRSALPYDITTGRDDNGDAVVRDRPSHVTRNSARGRAHADLGARLAWRSGFGGPRRDPPAGPQIRVIRGDGGNPLEGLPGGDNTQRYGIELYAQVFNVLNRTNPTLFSGVMTSPFFGQAVAAFSPRRLEIGARFTF